MAGLGTKLFLQGDTLSADEVNGYFMSQVVTKFATAAARDSAFGDGIPVSLGGSGKPSLSPGMICFVQFQADGITQLNRIQYYDGTYWQDSDQFFVGDGLITTAKLATNSVTSAKISALAVTTAKLTDDAVTTAKIVDSAVTSAKIADGTIVNADVSSSAGIDLGKLADATIEEKSPATIGAATNYSLVLTDKNKFIKMAFGVGIANTVTVPTNASVAWPIGSQIHIIQYGAGKTQVIPQNNTVTIYATPGTYLRAQYSSATLLKCETNVWLLMGDLSAS